MIDTLIFGPSDTYALTTLGFIIYLYKQNYLNEIKNIIGVDSGALLALLFGAGFSINEIITILINFKHINNSSYTLVAFSKYGFFNEDLIVNYFNSVFLKKFEYIPNLKQLSKITNRQITFVTYNVTDKCTEYFNSETHPTISSVMACVLSFVKPIIYGTIMYENKRYIGGIIGNPHPIDFYTNIDEAMAIYTIKENKGGSDFLDYIDILLNSQIMEHRAKNINSSELNIHNVEIGTPQTELFNADISVTDKYKLLITGYDIGIRFVKTLE